MALSEAVVEVTGDFSSLIDGSGEAGAEAGTQAGDQFLSSFEGIADAGASSIGADVGAGIESGLSGVGAGAADELTSEFSDAGQQIITDVEAGASGADAALSGIGDGAADELAGAFSGVGDQIAADVGGGAGEATNDLTTLGNEGESVADSLTSSFKGLGAALAAIGIAAGLGQLASAAERINTIGNITAQLIETTGASANVTADQMRELGDTLERTTAIESELVQEAGNVLLTFRNVRNEVGEGNDVFDRAIVAAADLSTVLGTDMQAATLQLGKALQDPVQGMTALTRAGVTFTEEQKEMVRSLVESGDTLSAQRFILEELEGQVAGTAQAAADASDIMRNKFGEVTDAFALGLLPALDAGVGGVDGFAESLLPLAEELGVLTGEILTVAIEAFGSLAPAVGTTSDLIRLMLPVVESLVGLIDLLPDPLLGVAGGFFAISRAIRAANFASATLGVSSLTGSLGGLAAAARAHPVLAIAGAIGAIGVAASQNEDGFQGFIRSVDDAVTSLIGMETQTEKVEGTVGRLVGDRDLSSAEDLVSVLDDMNDIMETINSGSPEEALAAIVDTVGGDNLDDTNAFLDAMEELGELLEDSARSALAAAAAEGTLNDEFLGQAAALSVTNAGAEEWVALLEQATPSIEANAEAAADLTERYADVVAVTELSADATNRLMFESGDLSVALLNIKNGAGSTEENLLAFAIAAKDAALSEEEMGELAAVLGVEMEDLASFIEETNAAIDDFANTALGQLPSVADAFREMNEEGENAKITASDFLEALAVDTAQINEFRSNLESISSAGFDSIAGIIAQRGPEVAGDLAAELGAAAESGNTALLTEVEAGVAEAEAAYNSMEEFLRTELGPQFILTNGLLGSAATAAFGDNLTFEERLRVAGGLAQSEMSDQGKAIAAVAAAEGADAAREYGKTVLGMEGETVEAAIAAGEALLESGLPEEFRRFGVATADGFILGIRVVADSGRVQSQVNRLAIQAKGAMTTGLQLASPSKIFMQYGVDTADGFTLGIESQEQAVARAAESLAQAAVSGAESVEPLSPQVTAASVAGATSVVGSNADQVAQQVLNNVGTAVAAGQTAQPIIVQIRLDGDSLSLAQLDLLRQAVQVEGNGNVQEALGSGGT